MSSGTEYSEAGDDYAPLKTTAASKKIAVAKPKKAPAKSKKILANVSAAGLGDAAAAAEPDGFDSFSGSLSASSKKQIPVKGGKSIEEIYQKKTQLEHILIRPDTYIGSTEFINTPLWVFDGERMVHRPISFVPGLYKIFDEIIVNAADNKVRDPTMDTIKISIDREKNTISVYNNGRGIPIEIHAKEQIYVPELIFGHLLTSSNYDDDEKKVTGGRNGYGAKLCNIFSTYFMVETADSRSGRKFKQVFSNNMSSKTTPTITQNNKGEDFTQITFKPDLEKFKMTVIDDDFEALLKKRAYDLAGCVRGIKVFLNNTRIKIKDFKDYVDLYLDNVNPETGLKPPIVYEKLNDRWEIAYTPSDGQFNQVSFANSICTSKGGTHVNTIADQIVTGLMDQVKKKDKKAVPLKPHQAKSHIWIFVNCQVENPTFDSQTKETLTLRTSAFGSKTPISEEFMKKVFRSGIIDTIMKFAKFKQDQLLKKTDGSGKKSRINGITKLDDANNAGTKNGGKCTLILTEGDSAKSLAVSGLSVVGRDNFGVFPLRGKLLNVREATHAQITGNAEISAIKQILGLQHGKVYEDASTLRYGHLMIMTDQDHDGSHIKGLIINFLDHFWPSLLYIPGFLLEFITPIVRATKGKGHNKQEISFFTIPEFEQWKEVNSGGRGWTTKYFKGLGTSTTADAKEYFSDMNKHLKPFCRLDDESRELIDMAFNKKKADSRKEWLGRFQPGTYMDHSVTEISLPDFINRELILFSMADNARSIPSSVDGFKPGQRKILFACFKRNLKSEIKVAQLAGYVAEHSAYHHGEQSLNATIVNMAQNFIGSNNLGVLEPLGQFGTRLQGGKDAASPRYIFTNLTPLARTVFHPSDDPLLTYLVDDGQNIEPEWYLPVLPMLLVNGADGIGTGWSSSIPNYNPRDIVECLHRLMRHEELFEIHPWYRGFSGKIERETPERYKVTGCIRKIDSNTVEITELPIRTWTQSYKEQLEAWLTGTEKQTAWIKDYKEYHTDSKVHFIVTLTDQAMSLAESEGLEKRFKLISSVSVSNIVCFDLEGRIRKYDGVQDIIKDFYELRLSYYQKRKNHMLQTLTFEYERLESKVRFVTEIITGKLVVQNRKRVDLLKELVTRKYKLIPKKKAGSEATNGSEGSDDANDGDESVQDDDPRQGYDYLLSMPIWNLTWEKVQQLQKEMQDREDEIKALIGKTIHDLWRFDLDAFLAQWDLYESGLNQLESYRPDNSTSAMDGLHKKNGGTAAAKKAMAAISRKAKKVANNKRDSDDDFDDDFKPIDKHFASNSDGSKAPKPASVRAPTIKTEPKSQSLISNFVTKTLPTASESVSSKRDFAKLESVDTTISPDTSMDSIIHSVKSNSSDPEQAPKRRFIGGKKAAVPTNQELKQAVSKTLKKPIQMVVSDEESDIKKASEFDMLLSSPSKVLKPAKKTAPSKSKAVGKQASIKKIDDEIDQDTDSTHVQSTIQSLARLKSVKIPATKKVKKEIVVSDDDSASESFGKSDEDDDFNFDSGLDEDVKPGKSKPKPSKTSAALKSKPKATASRKMVDSDDDMEKSDNIRVGRATARKVTSYRVDDESQASESD
ncbi:DNA topoisomerase 2 [Batrachochytrium dendrobatidis]|nr:DNA topoisomerase 2 [Batrachochytrium dendrobatidis]KAK5671777.1 DNA topoisomerase 2 [Batrachochytrium dendrobatidis]